MSRMLFVLSVSLGSVLFGYLLRRWWTGATAMEGAGPPRLARSETTRNRLESVSAKLKIAAIFVLNPVPIINSFWALPLEERGLLVMPILGIISLSVAGGSAIVMNRLLRIPPKRAASVFTSGMFTNILAFGGLIAFVLFGHIGYAIVQLYNMFIDFGYYVVGFPVSRRLSLGAGKRAEISFSLIREQPFLFIPVAAIVAGLFLNVFGIDRPRLLHEASSVLIPTISAMLGTAIGLTLYIGRIARYTKEIALVSAIKFLIVPSVMIPLAAAIGLTGVMGGLPFNVVVIVSFMPVAFTALVPPAIYGFDLDLANSAWIVTTLALAVIVPALFAVLG